MVQQLFALIAERLKDQQRLRDWINSNTFYNMMAIKAVLAWIKMIAKSASEKDSWYYQPGTK